MGSVLSGSSRVSRGARVGSDSVVVVGEHAKSSARHAGGKIEIGTAARSVETGTAARLVDTERTGMRRL